MLAACRTLLQQVFSASRPHRRRPVAASIRTVDALEPRTLLSATLTANEQLLLELVNRARANPGTEASRFGIGLNDGVSAQNTIANTPKQPLAPNQALTRAAQVHAQDMLNRNFFSHTAPYNTPNDPNSGTPFGRSAQNRAETFGYGGSAGENIGWSGTTGPLDQEAYVYIRHERLFRSQGHRVNLLRDIYTEIGTGVRYGDFTHTDGVTYNSAIVAEVFGTYFNQNPTYVTGVVFSDATSGSRNDDFYSIGEGVGGGSVTAFSINSNASYTSDVGAAGGYAITAPDGSYDVVLTLADGSQYIVQNVQIAGQNIKVDFELTTATPFNPGGGNNGPTGRQDTVAFNTLTAGWWVGIVVDNGDGTRTLTNARYAQWDRGVDWQFTNTGDFNGDGLTDIAGWNPDTGLWHVGLNNGVDAFVTTTWGRWSSGAGWQNVHIGDFNGDGRDDIVARSGGGTWFLAQSNGSRFTTSGRKAWSRDFDWGNVTVADFNGDGTVDVAGRNNNGQWFVSTGWESRAAFTTSYYGWWTPHLDWRHIRVADFNGDGRADIAGMAGHTGNVFVSLGNGTDFTTTLWGRFGRNRTFDHATIGHFGGDTNPDYVLYDTESGTWLAGISLSTVFEVDTNFASLDPNMDWQHIVPSDVDGDGIQELLILGDAPTNGRWYEQDIAAGGAPVQIGQWGPSRFWTDLTVAELG